MKWLSVFKKKLTNVNWGSVLFLSGYHVLLAVLLPIYLMSHSPSGGLIGWTVALFFLTGMAITAGYHRLYSHLTYKTNKVIEAILMFFATMATQGSAIRWSHDHRIHHSHIDQDEDPYTVKRGFWHAHMWWMVKTQAPINKKIVSDLYRNKLLTFQHKYFEVLMLITNALGVLFVGYLVGDYFGAFVFCWLLRLFLVHHATWFINSLAHYWGHQNYSTEHSAVDNYIICFLTFGEGYHNYHHTFAGDYRNGIKWYHFDPTKWLIYLLHKLKLAKGLRRVNDLKIQQQMVIQHKQILIEKLAKSIVTKKDEVLDRVSQYGDTLHENLQKMQKLVKQYKDAKQSKALSHPAIKELKKEVAALKKMLKKDWIEWRKCSRFVLKLQEQAA